MGVTPAQLARYYPRIYHIADGSSWDGIQHHGLLCTEYLTKLFQVPTEKRDLILTQQRNAPVPIEHAIHGKAVIRDQKPLIRSKLEGCLIDCSFQAWLQMLNSRVFFWLTRERLQTLMCAREYCADAHVVLQLNTLRLANDFQERITLTPMNTGNTRPFAHARGLSTFSRMADYPFEQRLRLGLYYTVVELAVEVGVPNIMDYVIEAAVMRCSDCNRSENQNIQLVRTLFP
jgi:hypothetical protein